MGTVLLVVAGLCTLVSVVCWILTLIKMFTNDSALQGIIGLICGIYALIWAWMHREDAGALAPIWTVALVAGVAARAALMAMSTS